MTEPKMGRFSVEVDLASTPCRRVFAGVRKIVACENPNERPAHGIELTYNEFVVESMESLRKIADGESVRLEYES